MQIIVKGRHVDVNDQVRDYIHEKASKVTRFYDRIQEIEVVLDQESEQFTCEMIVRADHHTTTVARETGPEAFALVDLVVDKIERQIIKHKEKLRNNKKGGPAADGSTTP